MQESYGCRSLIAVHTAAAKRKQDLAAGSSLHRTAPPYRSQCFGRQPDRHGFILRARVCASNEQLPTSYCVARLATPTNDREVQAAVSTLHRRIGRGRLRPVHCLDSNGRCWESAVGHCYKPNISIGSKVPASIRPSTEPLVAKTKHLSPQAGHVCYGSRADLRQNKKSASNLTTTKPRWNVLSPSFACGSST
jgi:hypothetical protein